MSDTNNNVVIVGKLASAFGVRGWIKVNSYTRPATNILDYQPWQVFYQGQWQTINITDHNINNGIISIKFVGCDDRNQAKLYTNADIGINPDQLPALPSGEHYWHELEGLTVINQDGIVLGTVEKMMETGANDVLVVQAGETKRLIPHTKQTVTSVDLKKRQITVDWEKDY